MNTSLRHPVFSHPLVFHIGEAVELANSLDIVTHVFEVQGLDIQNKFITHKHLDEKLARLHEMWTLELGI